MRVCMCVSTCLSVWHVCACVCIYTGLHLSPKYITLVSFSSTILLVATIYSKSEHGTVEGWGPAH